MNIRNLPYVESPKGKSPRYRRRVPDEIREIVGVGRDFIRTVPGADPAIYATIHAECERVFRDAKNGDYPALSDPAIAKIVAAWINAEFPGYLKLTHLSGLRPSKHGPAGVSPLSAAKFDATTEKKRFTDESGLLASLTTYVAEHHPSIRPSGATFGRVRAKAIESYMAEIGFRDLSDDVEPSQPGEPLVVPAVRKAKQTSRRDGFALRDAYAGYIADPGVHLSQSTRNNLKTAYSEFIRFAGADITLEAVDRDLTGRFVTEHLPAKKSSRCPDGIAPATIARMVSLLTGIWKHAAKRGKIPFSAETPWDGQKPSTKVIRKTSNKREDFSAAQTVKLLNATTPGEPVGDIIRICLATGARLEEVADVDCSDVDQEGRSLRIIESIDDTGHRREIKTESAERIVPLHGIAREVVKDRFKAAGGKGPLFSELPIRQSTGKRSGSISQAFTRLRRRILGPETDGHLSQHSFRHTWRTAARRAGVSEPDIKQLGGWSAGDGTDVIYDHGQTLEHLMNESQRIVDYLQRKVISADR